MTQVIDIGCSASRVEKDYDAQIKNRFADVHPPRNVQIAQHPSGSARELFEFRNTNARKDSHLPVRLTTRSFWI